METNDNGNKKPPKAYDNKDFMHSRDGRTLRILSEYLYPEQFFRKHGINKAIVFYGSARILSPEQYSAKYKLLMDRLEKADLHAKIDVQNEINKLEKTKNLTSCYDEAVKLSEMLALWSETLHKKDKFYICTGGGPGMMEAGNRGAANAKIPTIGLNISLPFEQAPNPFVSPELSFEFHYFFMRKLWFVSLAEAFIALPGGFGTLDELFEILTLIQTTKVTRPIPIVLYNEKFWKNLINFEAFVENGLINKRDLDLIHFANTPEEAFNYITSQLIKIHKIEI